MVVLGGSELICIVWSEKEKRRERRDGGNASVYIELAIASSARPLWSRLRRLDPKIALDERQIPLLAKRLHFFFFLFTYKYSIREYLTSGGPWKRVWLLRFWRS
jgi:hypothetical protein